MYFEPTKRTYYRFPSNTSIQDFNTRYYYPDQPQAGDDIRHEGNSTNYTQSVANNYKD